MRVPILFGAIATLTVVPASAQTQQPSAPPLSGAPDKSPLPATPQQPAAAPQQSTGGLAGSTDSTLPGPTGAPGAGAAAGGAPAPGTAVPAAGSPAAPTPNPALVIGAQPPAAQAAPTGPVLSLNDAITQVLDLNPTLVQARITAKRFHDTIGQATGQGLPTVRIGASDAYSSVATSGVSTASASNVNTTGQLPNITDSAFSTSTVGTNTTVTGGLTSSTGTVATAGAGSTTTTGSTTTIVPVTSIGGGSVSSGPVTTGVITGGSSVLGGASTTTTGSGTGQGVFRKAAGTDGSGTTTTTTTTTGGTGTTLPPGFTFNTGNAGHVNNYGAEGSVTQIIDVYGLVRANVNVAREDARFYDADVRRIEDDEALTVKDTYFAVVKAESDVATSQELLRNAQAVLANAQINYRAGASPEYDVVSAQAQVASAQASLITSQNELDTDRANLNNLLTRPIDAAVNVAAVPLTTLPTTTPVGPEIASADRDRPELQESALSQDIAHNLTRLARQGLLPSLGLTGTVDYQPTSSSGEGSDTTAEITASVNLPLYDGGATPSAVKAARDTEAQQRSITDQLQQDIALEVKTALVNVLSAQALVTSDQAAVGSYREALRIAGITYQAGAGTLLSVTNAEANLANSESELNSAVYQQQSAYASLLRAVGRR